MELGVGIAAAAAAMASAVFVFFQVREMQRQTRLQREIAEGASQPYVWVDARLRDAKGFDLLLMIGNSGPTVATDVRVEIEPPFIPMKPGLMDGVQEMLAGQGLPSLAPGQQLGWYLGSAPKILKSHERSSPRRIVIHASGPFGPVPTTAYVIDLSRISQTIADHPGTLRDVAKSLDRIERTLKPNLEP